MKDLIKKILKEETKHEYILEIPNLRFIPNADLETPEGKTETWNELLRLLNGKPFIFDDDLDLYETDITSLGNLQSVNGYLDLRYCYKLTTLGNLKSVNGGLNLYRCTNLTSLGDLKSVGGDLILSYSKISSLGNLKFVGRNLTLSGSELALLYSEEEVQKMVHVEGEIIM